MKEKCDGGRRGGFAEATARRRTWSKTSEAGRKDCPVYLRQCEVNRSKGEGGNVMPRQKMGVWLREEEDEVRIKE